MHRRMLVTTALLLPLAAQAQAPGQGRVPPSFPAAQPRDDSRFSAEALRQMAAKEAEVQQKLAAFPSLRTIRGQVAGRDLTGFMTYLATAFARPGWDRQSLMGSQGRSVWTEADGWTGGKQAFVWVNIQYRHEENGMVPYTLITNMPD
mgnify:FL=1